MDEHAFYVTVVALVAMCLNRPLGISFRGFGRRFGIRIGGKENQQNECERKRSAD